MKKVVIGIDVGGSTTKIVGFEKTGEEEKKLIAPQFVSASDRGEEQPAGHHRQVHHREPLVK